MGGVVSPRCGDLLPNNLGPLPWKSAKTVVAVLYVNWWKIQGFLAQRTASTTKFRPAF